MPFVRGGELYKHLRQAKRFNEHRTRFYIIQLALALGHLHKKNVVYRHLKPENILMYDDGYICISDFGISKVIAPQKEEALQTLVGTSPEYIAPEMLQKAPAYSFSVDWWALGILTYEMIFGTAPFFS